MRSLARTGPFLSSDSAVTIILGYGICGLLAAVAGVLMTSSYGMGQASFGTGYDPMPQDAESGENS